MKDKKHIVIFSHGFGTKKDDRGLLSGEYGISEALNKFGIETVLFDYNVIDDINKTITVSPLSEEAKKLENIINDTIKENPRSVIDIIAHSQGCLIPGMILFKGIRKVILVAPSLDTDIERFVNLFKSRPSTVIDYEGISKLSRGDGSVTIIPKKHWIDRQKVKPIKLVNELSKISEVIVINAKQDDILGNIDISGLLNNIKIINLDGNHSFEGKDRENLIKVIKEIIL